MAYKIANIKWLRDQGWSISSSYASGLCPTYNEIVNEIPKGSITVDVNGTCVATSKAYANNQLVCEGDITIVPPVDCSEYEFDNKKPQTDQGAHVSVMLATSNYNKEQLSWTINDNWITAVTTGSYTPVPGTTLLVYACDVEANPTSSARTGSVTFTSTDGCSFLATCTQDGAVDCSAYDFVDRNISVASSSGSPIVAESSSSANTLTFSSSDSSNWITFNRVDTFINKMYICNVTENTSQDTRIGFAVFTSNDGCEFTATVTQSGKTQQTYEIGYTITSTSTRFRTPITYIRGSASIFTQSELSTEIDIIPYVESPEFGCEALTTKAITLADLLDLKVGDQLYEDVVGTNLCEVSSIRINVPTDPTNIKGRLVLTKR